MGYPAWEANTGLKGLPQHSTSCTMLGKAFEHIHRCSVDTSYPLVTCQAAIGMQSLSILGASKVQRVTLVYGLLVGLHHPLSLGAHALESR